MATHKHAALMLQYSQDWAEMPPNNKIIAWAKETGKKLRLSTYDMAVWKGGDRLFTLTTTLAQ